MKDFETMDDLEKKDTVFYCEKEILSLHSIYLL